MKFLVVGPGAMGSLFAARLKIAGNEIALVDYDKDRAQKITEQGIKVTGISGTYAVRIPTVVGAAPFAPDFILICVKSTDTRAAGQGASGSMGPETMVVTLQNGLGNMEILAEIFGPGKVLGGVTAQGATLLDEGMIRHAGEGETVIGTTGREDGPVQKLVSVMNQAGFKTRSADKVEELIWGKLVINVGINALTAITRLKNGRIPAIKGTRAVMEAAVEEAVSVARARGVQLPYEDPLAMVIGVCEATRENVSSMLQDVLKERATEVETINGAIAREGDVLGIPTPVNRTLTELVNAIQTTYQERLP
jgi:2-dehydropantoate 2-reductase